MKYRIGTQVLSIPQESLQKAQGTVVPWRDVAETCRVLHSVLKQVPEEPRTVVDGIAGSGFWGAVFRNVWPDVSLWLNESDKKCVPILRHNFPEEDVSSHDIMCWNPPQGDIGLLEFHHFTLHMIEDFKEVLTRWDKRFPRLIIADGACFGFKFGNLRHYGVKEEEEYYHLLSKAFQTFLHKRITVVSKFSNAAILLLENQEKEMRFVPPSNIKLSRGGEPHKVKSIPSQKSEGLWS